MEWKYKFIPDISPEAFNRAYNGLSAERKAQIELFRKEEDRRRSIAGEIIIRELLNEKFGIKAPEILRDCRGKPYLKNEKIYISISHSGDLCACAANTEPIGIDAQKTVPFSQRLIERIITPKEKEYILSHQNKTQGFYEIWTAKEAYIKKLGGLLSDFKSIDTLDLNKEVFFIEEYIVSIVI